MNGMIKKGSFELIKLKFILALTIRENKKGFRVSLSDWASLT